MINIKPALTGIACNLQMSVSTAIRTMTDQTEELLAEETLYLEAAFNSAIGRLPVSRTKEIFAAIRSLRQQIAARITRLAGSLDPVELLYLQTEIDHCLDRLLEEHLQSAINELVARAERDHLTGLRHRAGFEERLAKEIDRSNRYQRSLALILFDIDGFKLINDRFGHSTGDLLLTQFALMMKGCIRQSDEAFRLGGDEFAVICPEIDAAAAQFVGSRIRMEMKRLLAVNGLEENSGVSWGVAACPDDTDNSDNLILIADRRLYDHKTLHRLNAASDRRHD